ncbi:MAG TPA: toll/interleukin-1 receptor domain-containing protein [Candidatus Wujingus californicus]|uniref:toll/interleukin-1 receptor domain-containing protein n=1 Tax=Candidatus Wujingus californicus TaxID=3367618 RepID=UPI001DB8BA42|nr:toll/interleukin-1 receptor domain-containing protein [Planctomycetota bacterium]MDO8095093.1 toll/interleukin-1 receptor domain-containing protein [Candidatus Brocadiales bacterium]MDO8132410.1 toll/interleukin-1 receptor domain-containing protein [Candidatus Brocadiales bacterium]
MNNSDLFEKVESLQNLLISRATGGEAHEAQYKMLRSDLMNDSLLVDKLPRFVRTCFDLNQFWNFIKHEFVSYHERREFLRSEFKPILEMIEMKGINASKSIFLSHSSKDKFFVRTLADHLRSYGIKIWLDEAEINIGDSLTEKIGEAIENTDYVGVVLSHNSINSEWVQRELQIALQKEIKGKKVVVLPILIETVEIPPFLKDKLYADFTSPDKFEQELPKLLRALGSSVEKEKEILETKPVEIPQKIPAHLTPIERRLTTFEDIKILEIDDGKSYKPDPTKLLYNIYLKLSESPPTDWQQIFEAERRFPRHTMWRDSWIEGEYIVVHCVPDEIGKYHANDLKEDVRNSNAKYRQYLTEEARKEAKKAERALSERNQLKELKQKIRFD